jgi:SpoVK/Ycf46/Vps4 family AAA+-type ATPase
MDGIESRERVVIMGATNRPDILDKALIRPGRFDRLIYIPPPDFEARKEIFNININKMNVEGEVDIDILSENTEMFSGAEINLICREAGMNAITRDLSNPIVSQEDFIYGIKLIKPIITKEMLEYFTGFGEKIKI